jgi:hypothetical protein
MSKSVSLMCGAITDVTTSKGTPHCKDNLRERIVAPVLRRADELLAARDRPPLPTGVSPHKLRHTYASILIAIGEDPASVMTQLGHTDPKFTLRVYTHLMRRDPEERQRLQALIRDEPETQQHARNSTLATSPTAHDNRLPNNMPHRALDDRRP